MGVTTVLYSRALVKAGRPPRIRRKQDESAGDDSDDGTVTWTSPTDGQSFVAGGAIVGAWSSDVDVPSPSFSLCMSDDSDDADSNDSGCGEMVNPDVDQMDSGYSTMSLTAPDVDTAGQFYLMMEDDDGYEYRSPVFSLLPQAASKNQSSTSSTPSLSPLSTIAHSAGSTTTSAATATVSIPGAAGPTAVPTAVNLNTHPQPSTLALAIPLSLIGATMLAALVMCCAKWRRSVRKRAASPPAFAQNVYPFAGYGTSNIPLGHPQDLEKAVSNLSAAVHMRTSPSRNLFLVPQLSQLGHGRSSFAEDRYTSRRERPRRVSRQHAVEDSPSIVGPRLAPRLPVHHSLTGPSFESFPSDHMDYTQPISSAARPTHARSAPRKSSAGMPFLARQVYAPPSLNAAHDAEDDILDSYLQESPAPETWAKFVSEPEPPPRAVHRPRSRPHSGDSMAYRLHPDSNSHESPEANVYRAVSQAIRKYS